MRHLVQDDTPTCCLHCQQEDWTTQKKK